MKSKWNENIKEIYHLIPNTFSHNDMKSFSSIFSGNDAKSTCSNWNELLANVLRAYLHLSLSMKPSLLRSKSTNMLLIYYRLKMPVLNPELLVNKYLAFA